jgi:hypothetical protein
MEIVTYHSDEGQYTALLVDRGRKWLRLILVAGGAGGALRVSRVALSEERHMRPQPYVLSRARGVLLARARRCGSTKEARAIIRALPR